MTLVEAIQSKWPFGDRFERRTQSQIERDLDDEFAFHVELKIRELTETGHSPEVADRLAHAAFGNIQQIKEQCTRIALEDRIMWKRIHFAITGLLALALALSIWVSVNRISREREVSMHNRMLADTARAHAQEAQAQAVAVQNFLSGALTAADPHSGNTPDAMRQALEQASQRIDRDFADNPAVAAELRRTIEEAKKKLNEGNDGN